MKKAIFIILCLFLMPLNILASNYINEYGLHSRPHMYYTQHELSIQTNVNYYYGDVEKPLNLQDVVTSNFKWTNQLSGSLFIQYAYHTKYIAYRAQIGFGNIKGKIDFQRLKSNGIYTTYQRYFSNTFILYNVGIEIYPIQEGFYIFVGIGGLTSIGGRYDINWYDESARETGSMIGNTVPMIPLGIGYKYNFKHIQLGVEISWYPALIDNYKCNIDGYASKKYPANSKTNAFADGFFNIGINVGYIIPVSRR